MPDATEGDQNGSRPGFRHVLVLNSTSCLCRQTVVEQVTKPFAAGDAMSRPVCRSVSAGVRQEPCISDHQLIVNSRLPPYDWWALGPCSSIFLDAVGRHRSLDVALMGQHPDLRHLGGHAHDEGEVTGAWSRNLALRSRRMVFRLATDKAARAPVRRLYAACWVTFCREFWSQLLLLMSAVAVQVVFAIAVIRTVALPVVVGQRPRESNFRERWLR